ncbi:MAG: lamin tail domain-containing protein [Acidobacteriota bacterium]
MKPTHAKLTLPRCSWLLSLMLFIVFHAVGAGQAPSINEVESNGGTPGDWFELINTGSSPVDVSGWKMLDGDDTHAPYVFPAGSTIAAGAYLVVEEAQFGFGLGAADSVRIYNSSGALFETYAWTAHAATTYGRCPNGTGAFITTTTSTKGAANDCSSPVKINEVESNLGVPGDWIELFNPSASPVNLAGFVVKDNDDTHNYTIPAGTTIAAGGYLVVEEAQLGFGLGSADSARLFDTTATIVDSYTWTAHAATTYGRCPNGLGGFITTSSATKGTANDCGVAVKISEVESNLGVPGDWIELVNPGVSTADLSGFVLRDNDDTHTYAIPGGTLLAPGAYLVVEEAALGFGLGAADSARLFDTAGGLVDSYSWTAHAATTYGRCPTPTGDFTTTTAPTKGTLNACPGVLSFSPWPGGQDVKTVDGTSVFGGNLSGLVYEGTGTAARGVLWAARNGPGSVFRMIFNGTIWVPDTTNSWGSGKLLAYPGGTGSPDSEGITFAGGSSNGGLYISVERDNNVNSISRNSILRVDPLTPGATLTATHEWNLTADLPVTGPNLGAEAVAWISDAYLTANNFFDESKNHTYNPSEYPNHGTGLFFVGLEANGNIYGYALDHSGNGAFTPPGDDHHRPDGRDGPATGSRAGRFLGDLR